MPSQLIEEHVEYAEKIAMNVCRNVPRSVDVGELYGAAYLALCKSATSFDGSKGATFVTWAYRPIRQAVTVEAWWIVNWRAWTNVGKSRSPTLTDWEDWRDTTADPAAQKSAFWYDLARDYLRQKLELLEEPDRTVIRLFFIDGVNRDDIAARLGKSVTSVSQYKRRGLDALWDALGGEQDELTALLETRPRCVVRDLAKYHASKAYSRPDSKTAYIRLNKARLDRFREAEMING